MRTTEYLEQLSENEQVTFIIAEARNDENTPLQHLEYRTTPVRCVWEWARNEKLANYIVTIKDHPPIDMTGTWVNWHKKGRLKCCVLISEETLHALYSEKQANDMIEFYERSVK